MTNKEISEYNQEILDEMVHECISSKASLVNNSGKESQIEFLIQEMGVDEFLENLVKHRI